MFALFKEGKQITKAHSTRAAVERGLVTRSSADFPGQSGCNIIIALDGFHEIREAR